MKKLFGYIVCILLGYNFVSANTNFLELLETKGIATQDLINAQTVERGIVTELLNIVDCQDCHRPTQDMISSLTPSWWNVFRTYPGNNFDDISYDTSLANTNDYYCIAYVGNKGYMNGFPRSTSPVCSGKFCSENNITNADVIQTVFNITAKIFYSQYKADRLQIGTRLATQPTDTQRYFGLEDIATIENGKKQCLSGSCTIDSTDSLQTYVKYCTYEPDACGMQEFPFAKQGKRPIAEMNILVQQGIFTTDDMQNLNIEDFAKGSFILDILGRVKERAQCVDNDDQDNDGIKDYADNCYITFNTHQLDTDEDKIGDVCDDDLDNDGIKNPIGIVDDEGNIVFDSIQGDTNALSEVLGLAIQQGLIRGDEYGFVAKYVGKLTDFSWNFGDGKTGKGIDVTHLYTTPGVYIVRLTAKDSKGKIIEAVSTLTVGAAAEQALALTIKQTKTVGNTYDFSPIVIGKLTDYVWDFGDGSAGKGELVNHTYTNGGTYTVRLTAKDSTGKTMIASSIVVVGGTNQIGLTIKQTRKTDTSYDFSPIAVGKLTDYVWDFGDGTTGKGEGVSHTYTNGGTYTVRLTAKDSTGKTITATSTVVASATVGLSIKQTKVSGNTYDLAPIAVGKLTDYVWDFGDGTTGKGELVSHTYTNGGTYTVRLTAKDSTGKVITTTSTVVASAAAGLSIKQTKVSGNTYDLAPIVVGKFTDYVWDFGDGTTGKGELVSHTYTKSGTYTVRLTAKDSTGKTITTTTQIIVGGATDNGGARASLMPSKLTQNVGEKVTYTIVLEGVDISDVDYVKLARGDGRTKELRGNDVQRFIDAYVSAGKYLIEGTLYLKSGTKLPLAAFVTVLPSNITTKDTMDNCLFIVNNNQLDDDKNKVGNACDIDDRVGISITPRAITQNHFAFISQYSGSLKNFVRFFGDRTTGSGESTLHTYRNAGLYTVRVEATTPKGKTVSATTTVTIGGPRVALVPAKLVQNVGEKVQYTLQLTNIQISDIDYVNIQRGDGRTREIRGQDITKFVDTYNTYGGYGIGGTVYLNNSSTLAVGSYVTVVGPYYCLGSTAGNWGGTCDMDKDTIPDICDTDIDGDGVINSLGLIRFQTLSCTYDGTNVNTNAIRPLSGSIQNGSDNCPFTANPDQAPCSALVKDTDGDGILDIYDVCPAIPELFNGIEDTDGCPEYNFIVSFPSTKVQPGTCNVCPCQYAQNDSALAPGDRVKAVLYDNVSQKPVAESTRYIVP